VFFIDGPSGAPYISDQKMTNWHFRAYLQH
jgi:hypothetical protein